MTMESSTFDQLARLSRAQPLLTHSHHPAPMMVVGAIRAWRSASRPSFLEHFMKQKRLAEQSNMASLTYRSWNPLASGVAATTRRQARS